MRTHSRSGRGVAVLGSKRPRQGRTPLHGPLSEITTAWQSPILFDIWQGPFRNVST